MPKKNSTGFSLVELLIGLTLSGMLGAFAYRAFTSSVTSSFQETGLQDLHKEVLQAVQLLQNDLALFDSNWRANGIAPVTLQDGKGPDGTDWLTIVVPDRKIPNLYKFNADMTPEYLFGEGSGGGSETDPDVIAIAQDNVKPNCGPVLETQDTVLIYKPLQYVMTHVTSATASGVPIICPVDPDTGEVACPPGDYLGNISFAPLEDSEMLSSTNQGIQGQYPGALSTFEYDKTVFQKVHILKYGLVDQANNQGVTKRYLYRVENGKTSVLAQMNDLQFSFDQAVTLTPTPSDGIIPPTPAPGYSDESATTAIKVAGISISPAGRRVKFAFRTAFDGASRTSSLQRGDISVIPTGTLANSYAGQPAMECYSDATCHTFVPVVNLGATYGASSGKLRIINSQTGTVVGAEMTLKTPSNDPFIPVSVAIVEDPTLHRSGIVVGGYAECSGVPCPAVVFIPKNSTSQKVESISSPVAKILPDPTGGGLIDTANITVVHNELYSHVLVGSMNKPSANSNLVIASYKLDPATGTFSNATSALTVSSGVNNVVLSGLGRGPSAMKVAPNAGYSSEQLVTYVPSNSAPGAADGKVRVVHYSGASGGAELNAATDKTIASHDWWGMGSDSDSQGNLYIGGHLTTHVIPASQVAQVYQGGSPSFVNLDEKTTIAGVTKYYDSYNVDASKIQAGGPASSMTIYENHGSAVFSANHMTPWVAMTNWSEGISSANALAAKITLSGISPKLVANVDPKFQLNETPVKVMDLSGTTSIVQTMIPPGEFSSANPTRTTPSVKCDLSRHNAFQCIATKFGKDIAPTPTPTAFSGGIGCCSPCGFILGGQSIPCGGPGVEFYCEDTGGVYPDNPGDC